MIALLNDANPNVYLEIGYAWAKAKPTILILKNGHNPHFDVRGQRYIEYRTISELRKKLTVEIASLRQQGVF
jgi:hypothetical protein